MAQEQGRGVWARGYDWVQSRVDVAGAVEASLHVRIPRGARTYFLGGTTLFFLIVQIITGILLSLYYRSSPEEAYQSILYIMNQVSFGWLIRSIHAWSANLMILACVLHMMRVFFQGAYKKPREVTWLVGVVLLLVTLVFGFTGYLLPWDQRAYWGTTVGTEIAGAAPIAGDFMLRFLRGGETLSGVTLSRFYSIHTLLLPLSIIMVVAVHLLLIHQQGLAPPPGEDEGEDDLP
jgi:quinol-cytochrome oxidoreductase complex cytochrome b subunit